jgi:hypothetical protein
MVALSEKATDLARGCARDMRSQIPPIVTADTNRKN